MINQSLFKQVSEQARKANAFANVELQDQAIICQAKTKDPETQAFYKLDVIEDNALQVGVYTLDRWLSESIETDLVEHKDDIADLLADEMYELGIDQGLPVFHCRDEQMQYVFLSQIPFLEGHAADSPAFVDYVCKVLLSYEATFSQLGDM